MEKDPDLEDQGTSSTMAERADAQADAPSSDVPRERTSGLDDTDKPNTS